MIGERVFLNGAPVGFGQAEIVVPATVTGSQWPLAFASSVVGAAAGWVIEEVAQKIRGRRRR